MSDLNKFKTINGLVESQFNAQPGRVNGIWLIATGANNAGQVGTVKDVGRVEIVRNGKPRINRSFNHFVDLNDIRNGTNIFNSVDGGEFKASCFIPFFEKGHPNVFNIRDNEELNVRFIPADDGTVFANLEIKFEQQMVSLEERYNYSILGNDLTPAAALDSDSFPLNTENVSAIYIDDSIDDIIASLAFESNNRNVITNNDLDALQAYTNLNNRIEDPSFSTVEIENHTPGVPGSTINRNNKLLVTTSGAGSIDVTVCSMDWH